MSLPWGHASAVPDPLDASLEAVVERAATVGIGRRVVDLLGRARRRLTPRSGAVGPLAEREGAFPAAEELSSNFLFTLRPDGAPDFLSQQFLAYAGLAPDVDAAGLLACVHPGDVARLRPWVKALKPGPQEMDVRLRRADGCYRWFQVRAESVDGPAGLRWRGAGSDVHDVAAPIEPTAQPDQFVGSLLAGIISDRCITIDRQWRVTNITPQALAWGGFVEADVMGFDARLRLPMSEPVRRAIEASLATGRPSHVEFEAIMRPGQWVEYHIYPFVGGVSVLFGDVTDRRLALRDFGGEKDLARTAPDAPAPQIVLLDEGGVVVAINEAWRSLEATRSPEPPYGVGSSYLEICRHVFPGCEESVIQRGLSGLIAGHRTSFSQSYLVGTPDGARWRQMRISQFAPGAAAHFIAIHEDVTDVTRAQAALRETSEKLLLTQDEERHRIAIELHDSTSQHLVALGMGVARLRRTLGGVASGVLDEMAGSLGEAIKEIRILSYLMNPPSLGRDGLETTARQFVRGFGTRTGLQAAFRTEGILDGLAPVVQHTAFRVLQEALSNVYRHAGAGAVDVELAKRSNELILRIADDGKGLALAHDLRGVQMGIGIPGMRARVAQFGGSLKVTNDGAGTVVTACIPLVVNPPATIVADQPARGSDPAVASMVFGPAKTETAGRGARRPKGGGGDRASARS